MKITFYIDWNAEEVYTEKEAKQVAADNMDMDLFFQWLDGYFTIRDVFEMNDDKKENLYDNWKGKKNESFFKYTYDTNTEELIKE